MKALQRRPVPISDDSAMGPAMLALDERRQKFVIAFVRGGGRDATQAVVAAGWTNGSHGAAKVQAYRLIREPGVLKALREEADRQLDSGVYIAAAALVEIAADPQHKDRYKAAADLMDRRGFLRVTGQHIEIEDKRTDIELIEYIRATALKHRLDPKLLLGSDAVDVTPPAKRGNVRGKRNVAQADAVTEVEDEQSGD
jgi:hypothetical protein